jgi:hypothetical protein
MNILSHLANLPNPLLVYGILLFRFTISQVSVGRF